MNGYVTDKAVSEVKKILNDKEVYKKMVDHNYETAEKHYSYSILHQKLHHLLSNSTCSIPWDVINEHSTAGMEIELKKWYIKPE